MKIVFLPIFTIFFISCSSAQIDYSELIERLCSEKIIFLSPENAEKYFKIKFHSDTTYENKKILQIKQSFENENKGTTSFSKLQIEYVNKENSLIFNYLHVSINENSTRRKSEIIHKIIKNLGESTIDTTYTSLDNKEFNLHYEWELKKPFRLMVAFKKDGYVGIGIENCDSYYDNTETEYDG